MNPPGGFRADGAFGQYSMVFPEQKAVVAIASESQDKAKTMALVWNTLLPELTKNEPLAANPVAVAGLKTRLKSLEYKPESFGLTSTLEKLIAGKTYYFEENELGIESMVFEFNKNTLSFRIKEKDIPEYLIQCGRNYWIIDKNYKPQPHSLFSRRRIDFDSKTAAAAGWADNDTLKISLRLIETCHGDYLTCVFKGNDLTIAPLFSVQKAEGKPDERKVLRATKR